jgi:hypothetical protein
MPRDSDGVYRVRIPNLYNGFDYVVVLGPRRSPRYRIDVVAPPDVQRLTLTVIPPEQPGGPPAVREHLAGEVSVPVGSRLHLRGELSRPVVAAFWVWLADRSVAGQPEADDVVPLTLAADGCSIEHEWSIERGGAFIIIVRDEFGLESTLDSEGHIVLQRGSPAAEAPSP